MGTMTKRLNLIFTLKSTRRVIKEQNSTTNVRVRTSLFQYTVKSALRGHLCDTGIVALYDRLPL